MAKSNASGLLTSLDSLFTTQEQRDAAKRDVVLDLPLDQIGDFPNHPFKVRQDEAMMDRITASDSFPSRLKDFILMACASDGVQSAWPIAS